MSVDRATAQTTNQPPLSNKGGNIPPNGNEKKQITVNLDWLRYTARYLAELPERANLQLAIPAYPVFFLTGSMTGNSRGYNRAMELSIGVIHWHTDHPEQGVSVELQGGALREARAAGVPDMALLQHIAGIGGHVSTMDAALDLHNFGADPMAIIALRDSGELRTKARQVGHYDSSARYHGGWRRGDTVYLGSPKSDQQIKVYNKAVEQGVDGDWIRFEVRWRDAKARNAHKAMLKSGIAATVRAALSNTIELPFSWWADLLAGEIADIEPVGRVEGDTRAWLIKQCLPAMKRELLSEHLDGESILLDAINEVLATFKEQN